MEIVKTRKDVTMTLAIEGRLDSLTSPQLEAEIVGKLDGVAHLIFDLSKLEFISSSGLRALLLTQKIMDKQGSMTIRNLPQEFREYFDEVGFSRVMRIE
ncbi:MAG: STAS domain-containing protein [Fibrobacter sp.]|jgi:anti-sigma B factor antagonist|nr:STAS domain-containing protein [Fibrobacter sp.]